MSTIQQTSQYVCQISFKRVVSVELEVKPNVSIFLPKKLNLSLRPRQNSMDEVTNDSLISTTASIETNNEQ